MINTDIYKRTISKSNIYSAIYSVESYIFDKSLLNKGNLIMLNRLSDKFDFTYIDTVIRKCKKKIESILTNNDELFHIQVFFKYKKYEDSKVGYRPIHTADLITQISMVCLLNQVMFEDVGNDDNAESKKEWKRKRSAISELIPSNFYGNIPDTNVDNLFVKWQSQYRKYSDNILEKSKQYKKTNKYSHEISLDLRNFFPSIDPKIIFNFIVKKITSIHSGPEMETFKLILYKLLYFEIDKIDKWEVLYYGDIRKTNTDIDTDKVNYSVGIPQGLPQSYFFGNLCMMLVSKCIEKQFPGDAYYYVDDSVIYSNNEGDITEIIKALNKSIEEEIEKYKKEISFEENPFEVAKQQTNWLFKIELNEEKSASEKIGQVSELTKLARIASNMSTLVSSTIDEIEDVTQADKLRKVCELIDKELKRIEKQKESKEEDEEKNEIEYHIKLLKRYIKFFRFRLKVFEMRTKEVSIKEIEELVSKFNIKIENETKKRDEVKDEEKKSFWDRFETEILFTEFELLYGSLADNPTVQKKLLADIEDFEKVFANIDDPETNLYYKECLNKKEEQQHFTSRKHISLNYVISKSIGAFDKTSDERRINKLIAITNDIKNNGLGDILEVLTRDKKYTNFVLNTSSNYQRTVVNAIYSHILSVPINDNYAIIRTDGRRVPYYALRLLTFIRTGHFEMNKFLDFAGKVLQEVKDNGFYDQDIDLGILKILPQITKSIRNQQYIDDIILVHKIVRSLWANGSKFLHFYTLHNEEHSMELIFNCLRLIRTIDYLKIKEYDYYLLFLSCYLHDISMVIHPDLDKFNEDQHESNIVYTNWKEKICTLFKDSVDTEVHSVDDVSKVRIKQLIIESFKWIDDHFQNKVRDNHCKESARFIKTDRSLNFINSAALQVIANVSEAHGYDANNVYGLRSSAKEDKISEKYLMILLRLADLLDISKDRISESLLQRNLQHMDPVSQFHWISHMVTNKCEIKATFELDKKKIDEIDLDLIFANYENAKPKSYIQEGIICETIIIELHVSAKHLTTGEDMKYKCKTHTFNHPNIFMLCINDKKAKCTKNCTLLCKWMSTKNEWLFNELFELQKYLSNVNNGLFKTKIMVNLHCSDIKIDQKYIDKIIESITKK